MLNKTVLITGGAQRIGAAIVKDLHTQGMDVIIHYKNSGQAADELFTKLNSVRPDSAHKVQADLSKENAINEVITEAIGFNDRLDVLINNASIFYASPIDDVTFDQWDELIDINMKAPFFLAQKASSELRKSQGCIINMVDIHAVRPLKDHPVYSAAKAGLVMLTKALAKELGPDIRVNGIAPGAILWPHKMSNESRQEILSRTTLKQPGDTEDIANAVRYLILDANYMTGQILTIDGGRTLYS